MSTEIIPGPALDCQDCGTLSPVSEREQREQTCPECGEFAEAVDITACDRGNDCTADDHDFGHDTPEGQAVHVAPVSV